MKKYLFPLGSLMALLVAFCIIGPTQKVEANPSFFSPTVQTASATTTVNYATAGTGTTTLTYDTYTAGNTYKTNSAVLFTQFAASSTASVLNINLQYSQDGIDWYSDNLVSASTTVNSVLYIQTANSYTWVAAGTATSSKAILIQTPTRFVRAIETIPVGAGAGAVWAQIVPNKETHE